MQLLMSLHTVQDVHIPNTLSRSKGVSVHQLVAIMHVHTNGSFQHNEDATAAVISCLKKGLIWLHHHL